MATEPEAGTVAVTPTGPSAPAGADPKAAGADTTVVSKEEIAKAHRRLNELIEASGAKDADEALEMIRKLKEKPADAEPKPVPATERPVRPKRKDFLDAAGYANEDAYEAAMDKYEADKDAWQEGQTKNTRNAEVEDAALEEEMGAVPPWAKGGTEVVVDGKAVQDPDDSEAIRWLIRGEACADLPDGQSPSPKQIRAAREKIMSLLDRYAARKLAAADKEAAAHRAGEPPASRAGKPASIKEPEPEMTADDWGKMSRAEKAAWMAAHPAPA